MNRYDGAPGKDAAMARTRQSRHEAEHRATNAFVKKVQMETAKMAGRPPEVKQEAMEFDSYMCNNGMHAQEFGRELTKGLDKEAFPVK